MMCKNPAPGDAPGLPERVQKMVDDLMSLTPEDKLVLAGNLEQSDDPDLIQFAAAIRRHVASGEDAA